MDVDSMWDRMWALVCSSNCFLDALRAVIAVDMASWWKRPSELDGKLQVSRRRG